MRRTPQADPCKIGAREDDSFVPFQLRADSPRAIEQGHIPSVNPWGETMSYMSHQFAHPETLDRARRWLVHAGFDPSQIEVITDGIPRIAIKLGPGQGAEAAMIIDAVERTDPDGLPSFWDLARQAHVHTEHTIAAETLGAETEPSTFIVGYQVPDDRPEQGSVGSILMNERYPGWPGVP
jgi:hypothetical protein